MENNGINDHVEGVTMSRDRDSFGILSPRQKEDGDNADDDQDDDDQATLPFPDFFGRVDGVLDVGVGVFHVVRGRFNLKKKRAMKKECKKQIEEVQKDDLVEVIQCFHKWLSCHTTNECICEDRERKTNTAQRRTARVTFAQHQCV